MKHLKIACGLVVIAGLMAVAAMPAIAANARWEQCKNVGTGGHWSNALCSKPTTNGAWETKEVTETEEVTSSDEVELTDTKATGGSSTIRCKRIDRGWIGANGGDGETEVRATGCVRVEGLCESNATIISINLPWYTQLAISGSEIRDTIRSAAAGGPGFKVECVTGGIFKIADECTGGISTKMTNSSDGNVQVEYDTVSEGESGTCKLGGVGSGRVRGHGHIQQRKEVATYVNIR
jgi:hypothetical protein